MTQNYPSNSQGRKQEASPEKNLTRVVRGDVVRRKKPLTKRFVETFFGGGDARTVWGYVAFEVLLPQAKDAFEDAVGAGLAQLLHGDPGRSSRRRGSNSNAPFVNYHSKFTGTGSRSHESHDAYRRFSNRGRSSHNFDEFVIESRVEAEEILDQMFDVLSQYEEVTVQELYKLLGVKSDFTDQKWGWTSLAGARVQHVRGGFLLDLPKPEPLD